MRHVPWLTLLAATTFAASPFGRNLFYGAFQSNEGISNSISQMLLLIALAIVAALGLLEWAVKFYWRGRHGRIAGK